MDRQLGMRGVDLQHAESPKECQAVGRVLALVGDKWSVMIIVKLGGGSMRFSEIKRSVSGISQRSLTLTLRGLEREGLVSRNVLPTQPPRVDYKLTRLGQSLWTVVEPLGAWARVHMAEMVLARSEFDTTLRDT